MEEIAHGIHEDHARRAPAQRQIEPLGTQREIETGGKGMARGAAKSFRKAFGVAVVTAGADLVQPVTGFQVASVHSIVLLSAISNLPPMS